MCRALFSYLQFSPISIPAVTITYPSSHWFQASSPNGDWFLGVSDWVVTDKRSHSFLCHWYTLECSTVLGTWVLCYFLEQWLWCMFYSGNYLHESHLLPHWVPLIVLMSLLIMYTICWREFLALSVWTGIHHWLETLAIKSGCGLG